MNEEMKDMFEELQEIKHKIEKMEHKFQKMGQNYGMRMGRNDGYNRGGNMGQAGGVFWGNQNPMMGGQMPMGDMNMNNGNQNSWFDPRFIQF